MDLNAVNAMTAENFVATFGGVFEHSPWVAQETCKVRPFASVEQMHGAMFNVVRSAPHAKIHTLLAMHPDLAGKEAQEGSMTSSSVAEQASARLDALSAPEMRKMSELNAAYRTRHNFPFIIAVRNYSKEEIFSEFERRLQHDSMTEFSNALEQISDIVGMRLERMFADGKTPAAVMENA